MNAMRKVLVVDDDPVVSKSFDRVLARKGYVVVSAENGAEALNKFSKEDYYAVFTDIKMPGMDGLEVAERLRAKRPWTPVVIITGYGSAENEKRAEAAGVRGFLRKPLSPEMIETSLDAAVAMALPAPAEMVPEVAVAVALDRRDSSRCRVARSGRRREHGQEHRPVPVQYCHVLRCAVRGACLRPPAPAHWVGGAGLDGWKGLAQRAALPGRSPTTSLVQCRHVLRGAVRGPCLHRPASAHRLGDVGRDGWARPCSRG